MPDSTQPPAGDVEAREAAANKLYDAGCPRPFASLYANFAISTYLAKLTSTKAEPSRIAEIRERNEVFDNLLTPVVDWRGGVEIHEDRAYLLSHITAIEAELTAQKAAHVKMLRDEADIFDSGLEPNDHIGGELAEMLRRLADKIEGGE